MQLLREQLIPFLLVRNMISRAPQLIRTAWAWKHSIQCSFARHTERYCIPLTHTHSLLRACKAKILACTRVYRCMCSSVWGAVRKTWRAFLVRHPMRSCLALTSVGTRQREYTSSCHTRTTTISSTTPSPVRPMSSHMSTPWLFAQITPTRCALAVSPCTVLATCQRASTTLQNARDSGCVVYTYHDAGCVPKGCIIQCNVQVGIVCLFCC